ncbi:hypothetical protein HZC33_03260 [Candidatus Wolfebacteria bacterium]|nr:hypothetical protein [Candidatus Wolfebacteria bacterium]
MAILLLLFLITFIFRFLIDYGCSSPMFYSIKKIERSSEVSEVFASMSFLGVSCGLWNMSFNVDVNLR